MKKRGHHHAIGRREEDSSGFRGRFLLVEKSLYGFCNSLTRLSGQLLAHKGLPAMHVPGAPPVIASSACTITCIAKRLRGAQHRPRCPWNQPGPMLAFM